MFKLLLSRTDSLKFKRKRNWDLFVNSLFQYFMINVQQRRNRTSHFTVHASSYILFKPNEYKRNYVWLSFCISLIMCTVCVCVRLPMPTWLHSSASHSPRVQSCAYSALSAPIRPYSSEPLMWCGCFSHQYLINCIMITREKSTSNSRNHIRGPYMENGLYTLG